jgi:hypothetical protein
MRMGSCDISSCWVRSLMELARRGTRRRANGNSTEISVGGFSLAGHVSELSALGPLSRPRHPLVTLLFSSTIGQGSICLLPAYQIVLL